MFFRRKRKNVEPRTREGRPGQLYELNGAWTGALYDYGPVRVPVSLDVDLFLQQRPMPSVRPGHEDFNAYVNGDDSLMRSFWVVVLLHHPDPAVRAQCLRSPHIECNAVLHSDRVAELLLDPEVCDAAADATWRMSEFSARAVITTVRSRGLEPSHFSPEQTRRALDLLRSTCPQERREFLEAEAPDVESTASRLVVLDEATESRYDGLTMQQRERWHDKRYLDGFVSAPATAPEWLRDHVEIRAIGHRLDEAGGFELMREVLRRAGEMSVHRMAERNIDRQWDGIGDWRG